MGEQGPTYYSAGDGVPTLEVQRSTQHALETRHAHEGSRPDATNGVRLEVEVGELLAV